MRKAFWDATGGLWAKGALAGKYASVFISTGTLGGGQGETSLFWNASVPDIDSAPESTALASMSTLAHHGIIYVPLGYAPAFPQLTNLQEIHGGKIQVSRACVCPSS